MKRTIILLAAALLLAASLSAQRTIKSVKFGTISLNTSEENFIKKLEKAGWKTIEAEQTTLQGKINGIDVTAIVIPDKERETIGEIILFTDANSTLNPTRYQVLKSWLTDIYGQPTVTDLQDGKGDISCYWGSFRKGERDLQKNNICITTAEGEVTVATLINRENALDATMNNIGDAVENIAGKAENTADKVADGAEGVWDKTKKGAGKLSKKANKIANNAATGAQNAWRSVKNAIKKKDKAN